MIYFETPRLVFRDWNKEDLREFQEMNQDSNVMEFFPNTLSQEETNDFYQKIQAEFQEFGYGLYAVETKHDHQFIGYIGFHRATFPADFTPCIEIGWRLKYEAWGKGYATEGARACLDYGFQHLNLNKVCSFTAKINLRSEKVMKKISMLKIKNFDHPKLDKNNPLSEHVLYEIYK